MPRQPSPLNELLRQQLTLAQQQDRQADEANGVGDMLEVPETGTLLSSAYEQLRNAAEYAEEHLLLQRAIKRFCNRNLFLGKRSNRSLGTEMIVELVQAGYLHGDEFSKETANKIDAYIEQYMQAFSELRSMHVNRDKATDWTLALISTSVENLLNPHHTQQATLFFAYQHFLRAIPKFELEELTHDTTNYEFCLYIAVHQALMKSDIDVVRYDFMNLYQQSTSDIHGYRNLNQQIDELYSSVLAQQLKRIVNRHGAPFRVLKTLIDQRPDTAELLQHEQLFMDAYGWQVSNDYKQLHIRLNRAFVKSILFLIITKMIIGIAVEVPYDYITKGVVDVLPLIVNLLFPAVYLASLRLSLSMPSKANAKSVKHYMEKLLYDSEPPEVLVVKQRHSSPFAKFNYTILFIIPIAITILVLRKIDFNIVQMIIFFIFFSTASYLGFRLSTLIREMELTTHLSGFLASVRDFFYLPFILAGQWLSRKYSKINAVARLLDIAVELPLKTLLRLIRQWILFLNEKHEELY